MMMSGKVCLLNISNVTISSAIKTVSDTAHEQMDINQENQEWQWKPLMLSETSMLLTVPRVVLIGKGETDVLCRLTDIHSGRL